MLKRAIVAASFAFTVGAMFGPADHPLGSGIFALVVLLLGLAAVRKERPFAPLLFAFGAFFAGLVATATRVPREETVSGEPGRMEAPIVWLEGVVAEAPELGIDADALIVDVSGTSTIAGTNMTPGHARIRVRVPHARTSTASVSRPVRAEPCAAAGDRVRIAAKLHPLTPDLMPHLRSRRLAVRRGVALAGAASSAESCVVIESADARSELARIARPFMRLRDRARAAILAGAAASDDEGGSADDGAHGGAERARATDERGALLAALATGDRSGLGAEMETRFFEAGLSHLFVLADLVMATLVFGAAGLVFAFARIALDRRSALRAAMIAVTPLAVVAALALGPAPAVLRMAIVLAALSIGVGLFALDAWSAVALGVIATIAWDPAGLGDVAFQLPFAALAAVLRTYPALRDAFFARVRVRSRVGRGVLAVIFAAAAIAIGSAPLVARIFDRVGIGSLSANAIAIPLGLVIAAPLGIVGGLLGSIAPALGAPLIRIASVLLGPVDGLASSLAMEGALHIPTPTILECLLFYLATALFSVPVQANIAPARPRRVGVRVLGWGALVLLFGSMVGGAVLGGTRGELRATFLPVAAGHAATIETPSGGVVATSSAPPSSGFDLGERVVASYLKLHRRPRADAVLVFGISEGELERARDLARQLHAREIWWAAREGEVPPTARARVGVERQRFLGDAAIELGSTRFERSPSGGVVVTEGNDVLELTPGRGALVGLDGIDVDPSLAVRGRRLSTREHGLVTVTLGRGIGVKTFRNAP